MRSFTSDFAAQLLRSHVRPYFVLEIQWDSGTKYYVDRESDDFDASGTRLPTVETAKVTSWGSMAMTLKEQQVGAIDSVAISIQDADGDITTLLGGETSQQRRVVKIWRMFDEDAVTWPTDAALIFAGTTSRHTYNEADNTVSLEVQDPSRRLLGSTGTIAGRDIFENVDPDYEDRVIPTVWGYAQRVEAVLISRPWEAALAEPIDRIDLKDETVLTLTTTLEALGLEDEQSVDVYMGSGDARVRFTALFHDGEPATLELNGDPSAEGIGGAFIDTNPAVKLEITSTTTGSGSFSGANIIGTAYAGSPSPSLDSFVTKYGYAVLLPVSGDPVGGTVRVITAWPDHEELGGGGYGWRIKFNETSLHSAATTGDDIWFYQLNKDNYRYDAGTAIRPVSGNWVYAANSLPSKAVLNVEGYGDKADRRSGGDKRKDFITIADSFALYELYEAHETLMQATSAHWTADVNDSDYSDAELLGRNITTVTFATPPRELMSGLDDNRIWVTLVGTSSDENVIDNPALVALEYLTNPFLLNVDLSLINYGSFYSAAADSAVGTRKASFAQTEVQGGLELLQDLARQCQSLIFYDQGQLAMRVLRNSSTDYSASFDENTILSGTLQIVETDIDDVVTRLNAAWRYQWDDKSKPRKVQAYNLGAELAFISNAKEMEVYLYNNREHVKDEIEFWLARWSRVYREVSFETLARALILQPGDWIKLGYEDGEGRQIIPDNTACEVLDVSDDSGSGTVSVRCRYVQFSF